MGKERAETITHDRFMELLRSGLEDRCARRGEESEVHYAGSDPLETYHAFAGHGSELRYYRAGHVLGAHCPARGEMFVTYATERVRRLGIDSVWAYTGVHHGTCPDRFAEEARGVPLPEDTGVPFI